MWPPHSQVAQFLVPQSNLLIGFRTGFTVKAWVEWELSSAIGRTDSGFTKVEENTFCHQRILQIWLPGIVFL